ncbi:MAG: hypothetical protein QM731_03155 [Chitinophagaceae bacterium]
MKKLALIATSFCFWGMLSAQIQKSKGASGTNQPASSSTTAAPSDADYFLAVAKITIKTGNDNKDNGAKLILRVYPATGTDNYRKGYCQENYTRELKKWATDEIPLPRAGEFNQSFNSLANYKQTGIMVDILYDTWGGPYPPLDAWKIEEVSVTLEFKDKEGKSHPTMGSKIIHFPNSNQYLDFTKWHLFCKTDQYMNPLTPFITKRD